MATLNPDALVVAAGFTVYTAPTNTAYPTDIDSPPSGSFTQLGYITEEGATFTRTPSVTPINAHQSNEPIRYVQESVETTMAFTLMQWDADTIPFAFGGGTWHSTANGWEFRPADPGVIDERVLIAEGVDGTTKVRYIIPRGMQQGATTVSLVKSDAAGLSVTFGAMAAGAGVKSWYLQTDSEEVDPVSSS